MIQIPMQQLPAFTEEVDIDNVPYTLDFEYNTSADFWTLSILTPASVQLISGIVLQIGVDLLKQYQYLAIPQGNLFVFDPSGSDAPVGRDDFVNGRLQLLYASPEEL
jgi:hypothetical protein